MYSSLKQEAFEGNLALSEHGLINLTFGNASACDRAKGVFAIKPSGVPYKKLKWKDIVIIDFEGKKVEGDLNPSSDTPTHRKLYLSFETVNGIVHTHSTYATAFAQAGSEIPIYGTTHADYFPGNVPVTRKMLGKEILGGAYEWETGSVITELFDEGGLSPLTYAAVLVNRHAPFTWGTGLQKAVEVAVALEYIAEMAFLSRLICPGLGTMENDLIEKHFFRKHGAGAYYGQDGRPANT